MDKSETAEDFKNGRENERKKDRKTERRDTRRWKKWKKTLLSVILFSIHHPCRERQKDCTAFCRSLLSPHNGVLYFPPFVILCFLTLFLIRGWLLYHGPLRQHAGLQCSDATACISPNCWYSCLRCKQLLFNVGLASGAPHAISTSFAVQ